MKGPLFYAKILLFGEYGIIKDSKGLAIPFNVFKGALKNEDVRSEKSIESNSHLNKFACYLRQCVENGEITTDFDFERMRNDLSEGMYFDSSIPRGYGVGSSGAIVAAFYEKYAIEKITILENLTREKLLQLKTLFGKMESHFHGNSSGLDPLNSYLSLPILIHSKQHIESTRIPSQNEIGKGAVFLLDSGIVGETAPMVNLFLENMKNEKYERIIQEEFVAHTDACIDHFLKADFKGLFGDLKKLSQVVFDHFKPMIPGQFHELWKKGLEGDSYYLKLCGSGGGGYFLGFTENLDKARAELKDYDLEVVYTF